MSRSAFALALCSLLAAGACGGSPAAPTPAYPDIAGTYTGFATIEFVSTVNGITWGTDLSLTCPATVVAKQSGGTVDLEPMLLSGSCGMITLPLSRASIDESGTIQSGAAGGFNEPGCGTYLYQPTAAGFYVSGQWGRELRMKLAATSEFCMDFTLFAALHR